MAKGIKFQCPDCHVPLGITSAIADNDGKVYLLGECDNCNTRFHFDIQGVLTVLYQPTKDRGN